MREVSRTRAKTSARIEGIAAAALLGTSACSTVEYEEVPAMGVEWARGAELTFALAALVYEGGRFGSYPEEIATLAASSVMARLPLCAEAITVADEVTYSFSDCEGAFGLRALSGELRAHYEVTSGQYEQSGEYVRVTLDGRAVHIDGFTVDVAASAVNTRTRAFWYNTDPPAGPNDTNRFSLGPGAIASGPHGIPMAFEQLQGVFGDEARCPGEAFDSPPTLDDPWDGAQGSFESGGERWIVTAEEVWRCGRACPSSGGSVSIWRQAGSGGRNLELRISFDGTAEALTYPDMQQEPGVDVGEPMQALALDCEVR